MDGHRLSDDDGNGPGNGAFTVNSTLDADALSDTVDSEKNGTTDEERIRERLRELSRRARRDRRDFEPPTDPPDEERAMQYLRDGAGQAIALYVHARTGGRFIHFDAEEFDALEEAMNDWLSLYGRCYGTALDASFSIRTAGEVLIDTEDVRDVAYLLTGIPEN